MVRQDGGHHPQKLFLSYASEDALAVESIYDRLKAAGCQPWMDRRDLLPGQDWRRFIFRAIRDADFIVVFLSRHSVNKRGYVQREITDALDLWKERLEDDIYLIPARLEECALPERLARFHRVDLFANSGFDRLLEAIRSAVVTVDNVQDPHRLGYDVKMITETDAEGLAYTMHVEYPQLRPIDDSSISEINERVAGFVSKMVLRFRKEALAGLDLSGEREKRQNSESWRDDLQVSFAVHLLTETLVATEFSIMTYGAGAAHPNSHTRTLNFRRHPTLELDLTDVVDPSSDYLRALSQYCIAELQRTRSSQEGLGVFDENWLSKGAGPNHDNFSKWVFIPGGIRVVFDPYQVDCYAAGRHEVDVPLVVLKPILRPDFVRMLS
jgi:hypothetical protein